MRVDLFFAILETSDRPHNEFHCKNTVLAPLFVFLLNRVFGTNSAKFRVRCSFSLIKTILNQRVRFRHRSDSRVSFQSVTSTNPIKQQYFCSPGPPGRASSASLRVIVGRLLSLVNFDLPYLTPLGDHCGAILRPFHIIWGSFWAGMVPEAVTAAILKFASISPCRVMFFS